MDVISSFSAHLATRETVHKARFFAQFWLAFLLRSISSWKGTMPWSTNRSVFDSGGVAVQQTEGRAGGRDGKSCAAI